MNFSRQTILVFLMSGGLSGLAGMSEICGIHLRLQQGLAVGHGYDGIILNALQFYSQAVGKDFIPAYILQLMPYLLTVFILFCTSVFKKEPQGKAPRALGLPFHAED
jgi:hypothetical protein